MLERLILAMIFMFLVWIILPVEQDKEQLSSPRLALIKEINSLNDYVYHIVCMDCNGNSQSFYVVENNWRVGAIVRISRNKIESVR